MNELEGIIAEEVAAEQRRAAARVISDSMQR